MKFYFYLALVFQVIVSISSLPSEDLWNKTLQYISEGKMKSFGKNYFIFDEENYTSLDINSKKMNILYDKQKDLYNHYSLRTFLFISKKLDRSIEDPYSIRNNIRDHLKNYGVYINNTVFVLISVETIESILYTGSIIKKSYISDNDAVILNNDIKQYIKKKEYYEALENFLIDIEDYFIYKNTNNNKGNNNNSTYSTTSYYKYSNDSPNILTIIFVIIFDVLTVVSIVCCCCYCKKNKKCCYSEKKARSSNNINNNDRNSSFSFESYGGNNNISIGGNSYGGASYGGNSMGGASYGGASYGGNSIGGASGGAF